MLMLKHETSLAQFSAYLACSPQSLFIYTTTFAQSAVAMLLPMLLVSDHPCCHRDYRSPKEAHSLDSLASCSVLQTLLGSPPGSSGSCSRSNLKTLHGYVIGLNNILLTLTVLVATIDAQWEGMGDVGSVRYEPALLPPCRTIRVLSYSN